METEHKSDLVNGKQYLILWVSSTYVHSKNIVQVFSYDVLWLYLSWKSYLLLCEWITYFYDVMIKILIKISTILVINFPCCLVISLNFLDKLFNKFQYFPSQINSFSSPLHMFAELQQVNKPTLGLMFDMVLQREMEGPTSDEGAQVGSIGKCVWLDHPLQYSTVVNSCSCCLLPFWAW